MTQLRKLGGLPVRNTRDLINERTRSCTLVYAPPKFGKTRFVATFDAYCKLRWGKPALVIAVEEGEGGGTMSIQEYGVDYVTPFTFAEAESVIASLASDTTYGGVALDSSTAWVNRFLKPYALAFPPKRDDSRAAQLREAGVPDWSTDYQTMGEKAREQFNRLVNLTTEMYPENVRKDLLVTALLKTKYDEKGERIIRIFPDLPGAMSDTASAMFQTVAGIKIEAKVEADPKDTKRTVRTYHRNIVTQADGVQILSDRLRCFPATGPLDFPMLYEQFWLPRIAEAKKKREACLSPEPCGTAKQVTGS